MLYETCFFLYINKNKIHCSVVTLYENFNVLWNLVILIFNSEFEIILPPSSILPPLSRMMLKETMFQLFNGEYLTHEN